MRISIDELIPGMYVGDVFNERGLLLFSAEALINDESQIIKLKNHGVSSVFVIPERGSIPVGNSAPEKFFEHSEFGAGFLNQLQNARKIHALAVTKLKQSCKAILKGNSTLSSVITWADGFVEEVLRNPDVFLAVSRMKSSDERLYVHSVNVSVLVAAAAKLLGYSRDIIIECAIGALLHDIGMLKIPDHIRENGRKLTSAEFILIKKHPSLGYDLLESSGFPSLAKSVVLQHHERQNGSGYPACLKGAQILEYAAICSIADVYDSLVTPTPYRSPCLPQEALALIFQGAGEEYPKDLVEAFTRFLGIYPVSSFVKLESGEMGLVIKNNLGSLLTPSLIICCDKKGNRLKRPFVRDLAASRSEAVPVPWRIEMSMNPEMYGVQMDMILAWLSGKPFAENPVRA